MKKIIFVKLLLLLGVFNVLIAQENIFDDIDSNEPAQVDNSHVVFNKSSIWENNFEDAVLRAKQQDKPILLYFTGSDWCGPCKMLDSELFHSQEFIDFAESKLVLYKADFPMNRDLVSTDKKIINQKLSKRYNQTSFPTILILNAQGDLLGKKEGTYMAEYYFPFFKEYTN